MAGIFDTIGMLAALVLAVPIGMFGVDQLVRGELSGVVFVAIAVGLVAIERYLFTPTDIPGLVAEKTVGKVAKTEESEADER